MAASKKNFFQAHWDWIVAFLGLAALAAAGAYLGIGMGESPESAAQAYAARLNAIRPAHEGVAAVDLDVLQKAYRIAKTPPALRAVDAKKASFLASERRVFCQKGDAASKEKACGRPIPAELEKCPYCGVKQHFVKVEVDSDNDGLPNDWEKKHGLNPNDAADRDADPDNDGFTNLEEYKAGTDPRDPKSHPDYADSLSSASELKQTFLPFWFKSYTPIPGGHRFTLQRLDGNGQDLRGYNATWSVKKDEAIDKTGYAVTGFQKKEELRAIEGSKTGAKKPVDVSAIELTRASDGKKISAMISVRKNPVEAQVEMSYDRNKSSWKKTVSVGTEIELNGEKYRVVKLRTADKGCEVTIEDLKTKKQKIVR